jgi:head-tail adaptor
MADAVGKMDQRITLRRLSRLSDGGGGVVESWADFAATPTVWAGVSFKGAREGLEEGRVNASQMTTFEIRERGDVTELDGILWLGEFYNIRAIRRYGPRKMRIWIDAERGVAN